MDLMREMFGGGVEIEQGLWWGMRGWGLGGGKGEGEGEEGEGEERKDEDEGILRGEGK